MSRFMDDFFTDFPVVPSWGILPSWGEMDLATAGFSPRVDVSETDKEVMVSAELPGMEEKDITVEMDEEAVTIRGERKEEKEDKGKNWFAREQSYGSFHRVIPMPAIVDGEKAIAKFKKGVLTVTVPKLAEDRAGRRMVKIETD